MHRSAQLLGSVMAFVLVVACSSGISSQSTMPSAGTTTMTAPLAMSPMAGNTNGRAGSMPAYYDHKLFTINFKELPANAEARLLAQNGQFNNIWQDDDGLPGGKPFVSVIDAVPADGMNPLWHEIQIRFNPGVTPRQLFSDDEIAAAAAAGQIRLMPTDELYRCSVTGPK